MGRSTVWDTGSGRFRFRRRGVGELHVACPTLRGDYVIGPLAEFEGDSRFFRYMDELIMLDILDLPEDEHIAAHIPESVMPKVREKRNKRTVQIKVAEEIERKQQERLSDTIAPEDVTEAFLSALPADVGKITIAFDFSGKGQSFTKRALRDIIFAYRGQLTMDSELSTKRKRNYEPVKWDVDTKWEDLTRAQLQSVAKQLSIRLGSKANREDLIDAIRIKVKGGK